MLDLVPDYEHIVRDNLSRFPAEYQNEYVAKALFDAALAQLKDRVYRNYKTAVPQYWRGRVQLLLPVCLTDPARADLALVVEKEPDGSAYRGNTVLTLDMAYRAARLLARPDRDWLVPTAPTSTADDLV